MEGERRGWGFERMICQCEGGKMPIRQKGLRWRERQWVEAACECAGNLAQSRSVTCTSPQDDATVKCWGKNYFGQLGYGDKSNRGDDSNGICPA
jgi:hypothetical protein